MRAPRLSSALILRRGIDDPRLYLARRAASLPFGGVWAFCGGTVDPVDEEVGAQAFPEDPLRGALASTLLREMIEELGVDLRPNPTTVIDAASRDALLADGGRWRAMVRPPEVAAIQTHALRLVTPEFYPKRFDTAFFLAVAEGAAEPDPWPGELDEGGWATPARWLDRWRRGEILLAPPTVVTLQALVDVAWRDMPAALAKLQVDVESDTPQPIHSDPAVRLIPLRTPTLPPARHTNAYLFGGEVAYLIDPATPHADEQGRLARALERAARDGIRPRAILLTHHHPDHVGAVEFVRRRFGWPVFAHAETAARVDFSVDRTLADGEVLDLGRAPDGRRGWTLECVFTPGHAAGHLCYRDNLYGALVAGDMFSTLSSILIHPDDGDLGHYMNSLQRLAALDVRVAYPAHGPADVSGAAAFQAQWEHRRRREAAVRAAVAAGARTVDAVTEAVYTDVPRAMLGYAAHSVRSILMMLERQGELSFADDTIDPS